jgi:hypothetical protein
VRPWKAKNGFGQSRIVLSIYYSLGSLFLSGRKSPVSFGRVDKDINVCDALTRFHGGFLGKGSVDFGHRSFPRNRGHCRSICWSLCFCSEGKDQSTWVRCHRCSSSPLHLSAPDYGSVFRSFVEYSSDESFESCRYHHVDSCADRGDGSCSGIILGSWMAISCAQLDVLQKGASDAASLVAVGFFFDSWVLALLVYSVLFMMSVSDLN